MVLCCRIALNAKLLGFVLIFHFLTCHVHVILVSFLKIYKNDTFVHFFLNVDDGALSLEEFKAYFSDGILSNDDLEKLFHDIDTHKTK